MYDNANSETVQVLAISLQAMGKTLYVGIKIIKSIGLFAAKTINTVYLAKWKGKTSLNRFRAIKGDEMQFMCIHTEDPVKLKQIFKEMKKHGILAGKLPDLCHNDGMTQFVVSPSDMGKMQAFLINHSKGPNRDIKIEPIKASDYHRTGVRSDGQPTEELKALEVSAGRELEKNKGIFQKNKGITQKNDPIPALPEELQRTLSGMHLAENPSLQKIRINKKETYLFGHERISAYSIPQSKFAVILDNKRVTDVKGNKDLADIFIDPKENYRIINKETRELSLMSGDRLSGMLMQPTYREQKERLQNMMKNVSVKAINNTVKSLDKKGPKAIGK